MNHVASQSKHMTAECRETMMEVQYFMASDFSLDPRLYSACRTGKSTSQQVEAVFNKISDSRNKNHPGLVSLCQGFQKCIA